MNTKLLGDSYEDFISNVYQMILYADLFGKTKTVEVEKKKKMPDKNGTVREIDIYWEYILVDQKYSTAVECKNYSSTITIEKVEAFVTKIKSLKINKGIMVAKSGFQSGAKSVADEHGISLIIIRKPEDKDWEGRIKKIQFSICFKPCPIINENSIELIVDEEWIKSNISDFDGSIKIDDYNANVYITNFHNSEVYSFFDIENRFLSREFYGEQVYENSFDNSYLIIKGANIKINYIKFKYLVPPPLTDTILMDYSDYLYAIMEYVGSEQKKVAVLKTGERKEID